MSRIQISLAKKKNYNDFSKGANYLELREKFIRENKTYGQNTIDDVIEVNLKNISEKLSYEKKIQKFLLLGEVQSGKTNNIIFLTSFLRDNDFKKFIILTGTKNNLNKQNINRFKQANQKSRFLPFSNKSNFFQNDNKTEFLYGIKQNIKNILINLEEMTQNQKSEFKIVIIDDECDEASSEKGKKNRSINNNIENIINCGFKNVLYFQITATPYANITHYTDWIKPDFLIPLVSPNSYCGLKIFNNNNLYVELKDQIVFSFKNKMLSNELKYFIKEVILKFLNKCIQYNRNFQFLINIDVGKNHIIWLEKIFRDAVSDLSIALMSSDFNDTFSMKTTKSDLIKIINKLKIKEVREGIEYLREKCPEIIIGGNLLSRGFTFEELLFEIMLNHSNSNELTADTLLQRARWFGYRSSYIKDMNIFTSKKAISFYKDIEIIENKLRKMYKEDSIHNDKKSEDIKEEFKKFSLRWTN
ncbi:Z1 domain-containing protein [Spiroplasma floricola]|uniref:Endonuclease Z1 domain-containing protein n=1 Tax=Spiroplasma floricola 23-6 TaxID=1336749 RepID=A0A2K8SEQ3_9MOLU|nr:Z1 domain-containing protein [Spiroplasma floricola]AUB31738.1 hypothetical protein SFLOR_v1c06900 [Spiroplasma floricola 23-6]